MTRSEIVLAAVAAAGQNVTFTPVQVQKLFFLLDREAAHLVQGPHFHFSAYDYGPFDRAVYDEFDQLSRQDFARVENTGRYRMYSLTPAGYQQGTTALNQLPQNTRAYIANVAGWVRQLSFQQLVASIYNRYPEMKANSVFRG